MVTQLDGGSDLEGVGYGHDETGLQPGATGSAGNSAGAVGCFDPYRCLSDVDLGRPVFVDLWRSIGAVRRFGVGRVGLTEVASLWRGAAGSGGDCGGDQEGNEGPARPRLRLANLTEHDYPRYFLCGTLTPVATPRAPEDNYVDALSANGAAASPGDAVVSGDDAVSDDAVVPGDAVVSGDGAVPGEALVPADAAVDGSSFRTLGLDDGSFGSVAWTVDDLELVDRALANSENRSVFVALVIHDPDLTDRTLDAARWAVELLASTRASVVGLLTLLEPEQAFPNRLPARQWNHAIAVSEELRKLCAPRDIGVDCFERLNGQPVEPKLAPSALPRVALDPCSYRADGWLPGRLVSPDLA
jgi:hypothetical protein